MFDRIIKVVRTEDALTSEETDAVLELIRKMNDPDDPHVFVDGNDEGWCVVIDDGAKHKAVMHPLTFLELFRDEI